MPFKDPEQMKMYMRARRAKEKAARQVNAKSVNPKRKPVNLSTTSSFQNPVNKVNRNPKRKPVNRQKYLLSYSRNKYQYTLYQISPEGQKSLVQSFHKNSIFSLPCADIELTWGPEVEK